ncbi:hypothetical protein FQZ97_802290 [compost metagenome]
MSLTALSTIQPFAGNLELLAKQVVEGFITGLHKSPFHGFSVEFAEHRLYNTGDSVKNIDWKLFAKTDKLFSKRYEEETNLRCQFVIDTSSSMYFPMADDHKLAFAIQSTASLIYLLRKQRDAFGLSLFSDGLDFSSQAKSTISHQQYLFSKLETLLQLPDQQQPTNLAKALHQIAESIHKRSLVIIFSDMMQTFYDEEKAGELLSALQHLKFNKHEVVIFRVNHKDKELNFNFEQRPYHFVDMETGETLKAHTLAVKEAYVKQISKHREALALKCAQYHIDMVDADIEAGFAKVLEGYLIKRQKMR